MHTNPKGSQCPLCLKYIINFYYHKKHCHKTKIIYDNKQLEKLNNINIIYEKKNEINNRQIELDEKYEFNKRIDKKGTRIEDFIFYKFFFIGNGATMNTYLCTDNNNSNFYAIKIENRKNRKNECEKEYNILSQLSNFEGFPKVFKHGYLQSKGFAIQSLIGPNLQNILTYINRGFDICIVAKIGIQLLDCLE